MNRYEIEVEFIRDILGSNAADEKIKREYIENKMITGHSGMSAAIAKERLDEEQMNALKDEELQELLGSLSKVALTIFYRDKKGLPCIADHQLRGWFKEAFAFLNQYNKYLMKRGKDGADDAAYKEDYSKRWICDRIKFSNRFYSFCPKIKKGEINILERPIRGMTPSGPRVSLKSSEQLSAGHKLSFDLETMPDVSERMVRDVLERGEFRGIGQWSNAQWGTFKVIKCKKLRN